MTQTGTQKNKQGILYIVATPIGNLEDITIRALRVLQAVSIIVCEDTRQTLKLLNRYNIKKKLISYFQPKEHLKIPLILNHLEQGEDVALVSDAGTPGISDPGFPLIKKTLEKGIKVIPIPGASAVTTSLSAAGLPTHKFLFLGFLPPKKTAADKLLESLKNETATLVFYIPTRNIPGFLAQIEKKLGDREVVIARELTKIHESFLRGSPGILIEKIRQVPLKGEATLLISGSRQKKKK
ncbi:MAG: 16S rRNA (cytidine(1402)-2'-O)-methyltransferase [Candidatus Aminicenantes bacterium]|nr:16S rRNA (cytidine(1402)-2'-O)-methyltransferase [Candidatus Aminicenantes bacterium]